MNLDQLDETYQMVKSKFYFVDFDQTNLIGGIHRFNRSDQICQFWVRTPCVSEMFVALNQRQAYELHLKFLALNFSDLIESTKLAISKSTHCLRIRFLVCWLNGQSCDSFPN
jgi:hypothetical protein